MLTLELCSTASSCPVANECQRNDAHYSKQDLDASVRVYRVNKWTAATPCRNFLHIQNSDTKSK